ncbi:MULTISPECIES: hypothetical protein [unclassified Streptomyces]|uniref:hypothetical protein n=1 Tax=unclassified Streptomyces TaxID=2593676 RepID=UPI000FFE6D05|nr:MULTISPECIES: hypothetical protein [unclassified Streptomyces]
MANRTLATAGLAVDGPSVLRPLRRVLTGLVLIAVSCAAVLGCRSAFSTWLPREIGRYQDYEAAPPCPAGPPTHAYEDCVRTVRFTVTDVHANAGSKGDHSATVTGSPFWNGTVDFGDWDPLLTALHKGDRVTGTVWHGSVMTLARGGARQSSIDEPRDEPQMVAVAGTFAALLAVLTFVFGAIVLTGVGGSRLQAAVRWRPYGMRLLTTVLTVCFVVGLICVWTGVAWWLTPGLSTLIVAVAAVVIYRRDPPRAAGAGR